MVNTTQIPTKEDLRDYGQLLDKYTLEEWQQMLENAKKREEKDKEEIELLELAVTEKTYINETKILLGMKREDRDNYVKAVIRSLSDGITKVTETKAKIEQMKLAKKLQKELEEKEVTLMTCMIYAIKPDFRDDFIQILKAISGVKEKIIGIEK